VQGGLPTTDKAGWNGNVMLISSGVLKESGNILHIESRNKTGGTDGDIDGFILDNAVAMYKTH
jgi:hypothetical protein